MSNLFDQGHRDTYNYQYAEQQHQADPSQQWLWEANRKSGNFGALPPWLLALMNANAKSLGIGLDKLIGSGGPSWPSWAVGSQGTPAAPPPPSSTPPPAPTANVNPSGTPTTLAGLGFGNEGPVYNPQASTQAPPPPGMHPYHRHILNALGY
jgi:hypothetical protein